MIRYFTLSICFALTAFAQVPPPHPAFDKDAVHEIRLRFPQADWYEMLTKNYSGTEGDSPYFTATFEWGAYKFDSVGVRFKGNSSYSGASTKKKPFRIKLNEFTKGQKIAGIGAFNLSNAWNDPSFVREKPYYEIATAAGLKAPRSNFAALYINDEYWGLYVLGEVVNGDFLKNYFGDGEDTGNLYKANIGASFAYLGADKAAYKAVWEKQSNEDADDWSDLIELTKLLNDTPASELRAKLEPIMDTDSVLTALAIDNATVNLDSYVGMGQNFNIYRRPSDKRWVWIPWDPSLAFGALSQGMTVDAMKQLALEWTNTGGGFGGGGGIPGGGVPPGGGGAPGGGNAATAGRPLATKFWAVPEYEARYKQIYRQLVDGVFLPGVTLARMNTLRDLIWPWVQKDTQKLVTQEQFEQAMTTDATIAGGGFPGGGIPGGGPPGGIPPGGIPPGGIPGGGFPAGGGLGAIPGLTPFIQDRITYLKTQLTAASISTLTIKGSTSALTFSMDAGGSADAQTVTLSLNDSSATAFYSAGATTASGGSWLNLNVTGGAVPGAFKVSVDASALSPGSYTGSISVRSAGAANSPLAIPVSLTVKAGAVPAVTSVVNAASYATGAISSGEIVAIFGTNLGPATLASGVFANGKLPTTVGGVKVTFDGIAAPLLYVSKNQLSAVVPFELSGAQTSIQVVYNGQTSAAVKQSVAAAAPGIFTALSSGSGQGAIANETGAANSATVPAAKGSIVVIYLTGGGQTDPAAISGSLGSASPLQRIKAPVTVLIGGQPANILYAGAVPGNIVGLYQINATVPATISSGNVPVQVTIGGVTSQSTATVAIQ